MAAAWFFVASEMKNEVLGVWGSGAEVWDA